MHCSDISIVDFEQVISEWVTKYVKVELTNETDLTWNKR